MSRSGNITLARTKYLHLTTCVNKWILHITQCPACRAYNNTHEIYYCDVAKALYGEIATAQDNYFLYVESMTGGIIENAHLNT